MGEEGIIYSSERSLL